jgi:O-antigen/teichoic acid export membrane protein
MAVSADVQTTPIPTGSAPTGGRVTRNAWVYLLGQLASWTVTFAYLSILPRLLAERAWGELTVATTVVTTIGAFFACGMESYLVKEIGRQPERSEHLIGATIGLRIAVLIPLVAVSLAALSLMHTNHTIWLIGILAVAQGCVILLSEPLRSVLAGWELAGRVSVLDLLLNTAPLFAIPFIIRGPRTAVPLMAAILCVTIVVAVIRWVVVGQRIRLAPIIDLPEWIRMVRGGLPFFVNVYIIQLYTAAAVFILRHYTKDDGAVGVLSQATKLCGTFMCIPTALSAALLPSLARLAEASPAEFKQKESRVFGLLMVLGMPVTAAVIVLAQPFCRLLYGPDKFLALPIVLQVTALAIIPLYIVSTMYQFLVAQNRNGIWVFFMAGTAGFYCVLSNILTPWTLQRYGNGVLGAAASTVIVETCSAVCAFVVLRSNPLTPTLAGRLVRALLATAVMTAVMYATRHAFILIPVVVGFAAFTVSGWWLRILAPEEAMRLTSVVQAGLRRVRGQA